MPRIAFIDHSFHRKTLSSGFLPELLRKYGHVVDYFWDESWRGKNYIEWQDVKSYDVIILFQAQCAIGLRYYSRLHPNVVYVPMLDQFGLWQGSVADLAEEFEPFRGCKVLNFSRALHDAVTELGIRSYIVQYYPPIPKDAEIRSDGLRGFFWLRREDQISWATIRGLIQGTRFDSFHLHFAGDPQAKKPGLPTRDEISLHNITISTWFKDKKDLDEILRRTNVYFTARLREGIGQSFLEAFARGQCVVAPDEGTMNEYITHGVNGFLYNVHNIHPIDFTRASELGRQARGDAVKGRAAWEAGEKELVDFILSANNEQYVDKHVGIPEDGKRKVSFVGTIKYLPQEYAILRKARFIWGPVKYYLLKLFRLMQK